MHEFTCKKEKEKACMFFLIFYLFFWGVWGGGGVLVLWRNNWVTRLVAVDVLFISSLCLFLNL